MCLDFLSVRFFHTLYCVSLFKPQEMDWVEKVKIFKPFDEGDSAQIE